MSESKPTQPCPKHLNVPCLPEAEIPMVSCIIPNKCACWYCRAGWLQLFEMRTRRLVLLQKVQPLTATRCRKSGGVSTKLRACRGFVGMFGCRCALPNRSIHRFANTGFSPLRRSANKCESDCKFDIDETFSCRVQRRTVTIIL